MGMNARDRHVRQLREQGFTWGAIADHLGMTLLQVRASRKAIADDKAVRRARTSSRSEK